MFACTLLLPLSALADGGFVRVRETIGPFVVTLFTSPTPLRAGPVDISVMAQERETNAPVLDAQVAVSLQHGGSGDPIAVIATRDQATNKLLYAALLDVPAAGTWAAQVTISRGTQTVEVRTTLDVDAPRPPLWSFWPSLAVPPLAIALFILHQWLARR